VRRAPRSRRAGGGVFAGEAAVFVDAAGTGALFRSEAGFASALAARALALGLPADGSRPRRAAWRRSRVRRLAASGARVPTQSRRARPRARPRARARVPRSAADRPARPRDALADALTRFGVHTGRDLLALPTPRTRDAARWADALALWRIARGESIETAAPEPRDRELTEAIDLEAPESRLEPLLFVLQGLLSRLVERLDARHLGCGDLDLSLDLADGGRDARRIGVAAPCRDLRVLIRLARHALERARSRRPLRACGSRRARRRCAAISSICSGRPGRRRRCSARRSPRSRVCAARRASALRWRWTPITPTPTALAPFAPPARARRARSRAAVHGCARAARAAAAGSGPGAPAGAAARVDPQRGRERRVVRCAGPWRTTGGWWSPEERFAFDQFDVQSEDGVVVRLRFDHVRREWQIDAIYD
jgi:hypothetical protein